MAKIPIFTFRGLGKISKRSFASWNKDEPFRLSAVVAYYALLSLPALLIIVINTAGYVFGEEAIQGKISTEIENMLGPDSAEQVETMITNASKQENSLIASIISIALLLFGATGAFFHLQKSLNIVWKVKEDPKNILKRVLLDRATAFGMILVIAFMLLISLVVTALISELTNWFMQYLPEFLVYLFYVINFIISILFITLLFALMFKVLPDVKIPWRVVWMGAFITALLFTIAKFGLGIYFGQTNPGSAYGAAGSIVLIMLWISYSCLVLFFGAEFTKEYAYYYKVDPKPSSYSVKYTEELKTVKER
ncbi:MAG: YihY/virulence factor BrkB family protein [bacterium]